MSFSRPRPFARLAAVLLTLGVIAGCSDTSTDPIEDDLVVGGVAILEAGVPLVTVVGAEITGRISAQEDQTGQLLSFVFLDDEAIEFTPFDNETMELEVDDPSVATFTAEGVFGGRFRGVQAGATTARIRFLQDGVPVYTTPPVPVDVIGPIQ